MEPVTSVSHEKPSIGKSQQSIGRRKRAIARIRLESSFSVQESSDLLEPNQIALSTMRINQKSVDQYFQTNSHWIGLIQKPFANLNFQPPQGMNIEVQVSGGGLTSQAEAIQLGIAKLLLGPPSNDFPSYQYRHSILKRSGFLHRDSRCKERKKYGLKKSRKASQFSKR